MYFECPKCSRKIEVVDKFQVEDYIYSDPHDPDEDYIKCPDCENIYPLGMGQELKEDGVCVKVLESDGCNLYIKDKEVISDDI